MSRRALLAALAACAPARARAQAQTSDPVPAGVVRPAQPAALRRERAAVPPDDRACNRRGTPVVTPTAAVERRRNRPTPPAPRASARPPSASRASRARSRRRRRRCRGPPQQTGGHTSPRRSIGARARLRQCLPPAGRAAPPAAAGARCPAIRSIRSASAWAAFLLRPSVELTRAYDSNAERSTGGAHRPIRWSRRNCWCARNGRCTN